MDHFPAVPASHLLKHLTHPTGQVECKWVGESTELSAARRSVVSGLGQYQDAIFASAKMEATSC
ncbi:hypothetical protein EMIT0P43_140080 [Pseudomonas jessenii]